MGFEKVKKARSPGGDESEVADNAAEERAEPSGYRGRTSFGLNQGDQRKEAADALKKKAEERSRHFLQPSAEDQALKDTARKMRGE
jgi:hypothetical protein